MINLVFINFNRGIPHAVFGFEYNALRRRSFGFNTKKKFRRTLVIPQAKYSVPMNLRTCKPGGLGNNKSKIDQGQLYTCEKAAHGSKHLGTFFPNGVNGFTSLIKIYKAATILMNMCCTVYGCQFTHELGYALRISIEELLQLCSGPTQW